MSDSAIPFLIERPGAVTYDMSTRGQVKITLPSSSTWSSGLHWHELHDEYLKVVKGSIRVRLGDTVQTISATSSSQPEIKVGRYVWHEWQRASHDGEEVIVIERTEPDDNEKAIFFWNLNGVILNAAGDVLNNPASFGSWVPPSLGGMVVDFWITLNLFVIFAHLDNVPVFLNTPKSLRVSKELARPLVYLDWIVSHFVLFVAGLVGRLLGVQPVQRRFTPPEVFTKWWSSQKRGREGKEA